MTFEEFKKNYYEIILSKKPSFLRKGQALFNYLSMEWPNEADRIVDIKDNGNEYMESIDCFADDSKIDNLMSHLEEVWTNYPN